MEFPKDDQIIHLNNTPTSPSPEMFSFPGTPNTDDQSEFEFGSCIAPDSPPCLISSSDDHVSKNNNNSNNNGTLLNVHFAITSSPADQFFLNGRLLPHDFPVVHSTRTSFSGRESMGPTTIAAVTLSRGTSNKSSSSSNSNSSGQQSSKDYSLVSSRSNSTNSTSSTCASSNTATKSSSCDKKLPFQKRMHSVRERSSSPLGQYYKYGASGSSQRWQFITAVPVLGRSQSLSRRGRKESGGSGGGSVGSATATSPKMTRDVGCKEKRSGGGGSSNGSLFHKILRSVVATCKACHAMEGQENEFELDAPTHVMGH